MARAKKQIITINNLDSLRGVMQEVYNDACNQIKDSQKVINELSVSANPEDADDLAKISKAKTDALKIKDSAIKIKLDVGKLQNDLIKNSGSVEEALPVSVTTGAPNLDNFDEIRKIIEERENK